MTLGDRRGRCGELDTGNPSAGLAADRLITAKLLPLMPGDEVLPLLVPPRQDAGLRMARHRKKRQKIMTAPRPRTRQPKQLDAGILQAEISSFGLRLVTAGNKSAKTIRTYIEAVRWFAAAQLLGQASRASWEQVDGRDIQQWMSWLLDRYSSAYASNQYRALQQFFKWLAAEDELPDPTEGLCSPRRSRSS